MKIEKSRVAALAPTALLFVSLFSAGSSGAWAQDMVPPPVEAPAEAKKTASAPQFYAEEIIQPLDDGRETPADVREFGAEAAARYRQAASLHELVGDMPIASELSGDMRCLAQAVYFEARGEPLDGQLAVARVVINRAGSQLYPDDYCSVVTQRAQFSFVRNGRIPQPDEHSAAWLRAKAVAQIAHQDLWESEAGDALYFHATYVKPGWARRKTQLARIDTHVFYR